uniref:(northern house mosquito) hypothetical protein n=1 Tax=Culex pipiens TaxID=7175 RepID=A0A8D8AFU9_CULPI
MFFFRYLREIPVLLLSSKTIKHFLSTVRLLHEKSFIRQTLRELNRKRRQLSFLFDDKYSSKEFHLALTERKNLRRPNLSSLLCEKLVMVFTIFGTNFDLTNTLAQFKYQILIDGHLRVCLRFLMSFVICYLPTLSLIHTKLKRQIKCYFSLSRLH